MLPINAALDADAGIYDSQKGCWDANVRDTAAIDAGGETDNVENAAATDGNDGLSSEESKLTEGIEYFLDGGKALVLLLAWNDDDFGLDIVRIEVGVNLGGIEGIDILIDNT